MHAVIPWFEHPLAQAIGWMLLHFVWQGAAVAAGAAVALAMMRRRSAQARYLVACAALGVMALSPVLTLRWCWSDADTIADAGRYFVRNETDVEVAPTREDGFAAIGVVRSVAQEEESSSAAPAFDSMTRLGLGWTEVHPTVGATDAGLTWDIWRQRLRPVMPWLVCAWFAGVSLLSVRLLAIWIVATFRSLRASACLLQTRMASMATTTMALAARVTENKYGLTCESWLADLRLFCIRELP
jgi:hypothetical protein